MKKEEKLLFFQQQAFLSKLTEKEVEKIEMDRRKTSESENLRDRKAHKKGLPPPLPLYTYLPGPPPIFPPSSPLFAKVCKKKKRPTDGW